MMRDKVLNESLHLWAVDVQRRPTLPAGLRADVRLFVSDEIGIGENRAVLQIVNAQRDGLAPRDRAEMTGQLEVAGMRLLNRRSQLTAGDVHVCLIGRHA